MRYLIFLCVFGTAFAATGFDAIVTISTSGFTCMKNHGYSFFIGRVLRSSGTTDGSGIQNIKNARAAGWTQVDGYLFPCTNCAETPAKQVLAAHNALKAAGAQVGMLWLDIEIYKWSTDKTTNRNIIKSMADELTALGYSWGVYSNYNNWNSVVGLDWTALSTKPLWWANYNGKQSFDGFKAFGGWTKPSIHQYQGDTTGPCGFYLDNNWY